MPFLGACVVAVLIHSKYEIFRGFYALSCPEYSAVVITLRDGFSCFRGRGYLVSMLMSISRKMPGGES